MRIEVASDDYGRKALVVTYPPQLWSSGPIRLHSTWDDRFDSNTFADACDRILMGIMEHCRVGYLAAWNAMLAAMPEPYMERAETIMLNRIECTLLAGRRPVDIPERRVARLDCYVPVCETALPSTSSEYPMTPQLQVEPFAVPADDARRIAAEEKAARQIIEARAGLVLGRDAVMHFFAALSFRLKVAPCWEIPTAATDGNYLYYNPAFWCSLTRPQQIAVFAHEVMHPALQHHTRRENREPVKWNAAADCCINPMLRSAKLELPKGALFPELFGLPPDKSAEEYYALLQDQEGGQSGQDPGGCGGVMDAGDEAMTAQSEADWKVEVSKAHTLARQRGTLPAAIDRLVAATLAPVVDWRQVLREFVSRQAKSDYAWLPSNRRFVHQGIYLPSLHSEELGDVFCALDVSGSISDATLQRFASELQGILDAFPGCELTIHFHDAEVAHVQFWKPSDGPLQLEPKGGGGTDHNPVFQYIDEQGWQPTCLVALTDMYSSFPDMPPDYPVLWCYPKGSHGTAPWGQSVEIVE